MNILLELICLGAYPQKHGSNQRYSRFESRLERVGKGFLDLPARGGDYKYRYKYGYRYKYRYWYPTTRIRIVVWNVVGNLKNVRPEVYHNS